MKKVIWIWMLLIVPCAFAQSDYDQAKVNAVESEISRLLVDVVMSFHDEHTHHWFDRARGVIERDAHYTTLSSFKTLVYEIINHQGSGIVQLEQLPERIKTELLRLKEGLYLAVELLPEQSHSGLQKSIKPKIDAFYTALTTKPSRILSVGYENVKPSAQALGSDLVVAMNYYSHEAVNNPPTNDLYYEHLRTKILIMLAQFLEHQSVRAQLTPAETEAVMMDLGNEKGVFKAEFYDRIKIKTNFTNRFVKVNAMIKNHIRVSLNSIFVFCELDIPLFQILPEYRGKHFRAVGIEHFISFEGNDGAIESSRLTRLSRAVKGATVR